MKSSMELPQKTKNRLAIQSSIPLQNVYLKDMIQALTHHVYCSTIHHIQALEIAQKPHN
jgi:hypothetical protein